MGQRYSPKQDEGRYVVQRKPMQISKGDVRAPGEDVPEAFTWPQRRRDSFQSLGLLVFIPKGVVVHTMPAKASPPSPPAAASPAAPAQPPKGDLSKMAKQR
jgi:hypothetical protein